MLRASRRLAVIAVGSIFLFKFFAAEAQESPNPFRASKTDGGELKVYNSATKQLEAVLTGKGPQPPSSCGAGQWYADEATPADLLRCGTKEIYRLEPEGPAQVSFPPSAGKWSLRPIFPKPSGDVPVPHGNDG